MTVTESDHGEISDNTVIFEFECPKGSEGAIRLICVHCSQVTSTAWCRINDKAFECNARRMLVLRPRQRGIHGDWSEGNSNKL